VVSDAKICFFTWFFHLLNVPHSLTEVASQLHVAKPVQPYAVFRKDYHRAWALGWPTREQYNVENRPGSLVMLPVCILFDLPLVVIQISLARLDDTSAGRNTYFSAVFTLLVSVLSLVLKVYALIEHVKARRTFYRTLKANTAEKSREECLEECDDPDFDRLMVNYRLLETHFNEKMPERVRQRAKTDGWLAQKTGRQPERHYRPRVSSAAYGLPEAHGLLGAQTPGAAASV